jgi:hypothetical protein
MHAMRLYLINPSNPLVSIVKVKESRWNRYRVWKPLSLMVLAGLSPPEWEISIVDEKPRRTGLSGHASAGPGGHYGFHLEGGCRAVFIGFETPTPEGLLELGKKFNLLKGRDFRGSVRRIQRHHILVAGSFIIGLDIDEPGIGKRIAEAASRYGVDNLNVLFLTPLPGTRLWDQMKSEDRIAFDTFPEDWKYYTLTFPVARYKHLSLDGIIEEMLSCDRDFYSMPRIVRRVWSNLWQQRKPLISLVGNLSYRSNLRLNRKAYADFKRQRGNRYD